MCKYLCVGFVNFTTVAIHIESGQAYISHEYLNRSNNLCKYSWSIHEQVVILLEVLSKDVSYGQLLVQHCFQTVLLQCSARV